MNNKVYDILKFVAQIVLPAIASFVIAVFNIWGIPYGEAIGGTIMALDTLLGTVLMISSNTYNKVNKATSAKKK